VRRAVAIQLIINKELGLNFCENPWQGSFIVDKLTDLVEEAVYKEFERISERGGVLGAMDTMYQRGKIQEESLYYEHKKHDGSLPLIGVNTFLPQGPRRRHRHRDRTDPLHRSGKSPADRQRRELPAAPQRPWFRSS
jgi:methylmalonyl-CoA mutase N-terminal domain/subunit